MKVAFPLKRFNMEKQEMLSRKVEISFPAMGGLFHYMAFPQNRIDKSGVLDLFKSAHKEVKRIEKKYTEFQKSELSRINLFANKGPYYIDEETMFLLEKSKFFFEISKGVFDITYSKRNELWRESLVRKLSIMEKFRMNNSVDFNKVKIDKYNNSIFFMKKGIRIGFGGIGKGYAVDRAFDFLKSKGLVNFCVNGEGDIRVHSHKEAPRKWKIGIRNPLNENPNTFAGFVLAENESISTSGSYIQNSGGSKKYRSHHIYSKYKDEKEAPPISCTVIARDCLTSDVWATIGMAHDVKKGISLFQKYKINGTIIDSRGKTHRSIYSHA